MAGTGVMPVRRPMSSATSTTFSGPMSVMSLAKTELTDFLVASRSRIGPGASAARSGHAPDRVADVDLDRSGLVGLLRAHAVGKRGDEYEGLERRAGLAALALDGHVVLLRLEVPSAHHGDHFAGTRLDRDQGSRRVALLVQGARDRGFSGLLHLEVERRAHHEPAAIELLLPVRLGELLLDPLHEVRRGRRGALQADGRDGRSQRLRRAARR